MPKNKYVFAVCGAAVHIHTLHFSLEMLKKRTQYEIIVVTDPSRNEFPIHHDTIINIATPSEFTHHQAAIYLKTSLYKILPNDALYCYLDSDVVAVRANVDSIFDYFTAPITFCTDHCTIKAFSPTAVHDTFYDALLEKQEKLTRLYEHYWREEERQKELAGTHLQKITQLKHQFNQKRPLHASTLKNKDLLSILFSKIIYQYIYNLNILITESANRIQQLEKLHRRCFKLPLNFDLFINEQGYQYDATAEKWYGIDGTFIYEENLIVRRIEATSAFRWNRSAQQWYDESGNNISTIESDKLRQLIQYKFDLQIEDEHWQHWNGGVFLFDRSSHTFLERWHLWTMEIFKDSAWKIRDQGTLIATVWDFKLQHHPTLPIEYNLIADFYHPTLQYKGQFVFDINNNKRNIKPYFIHIYHHWGNTEWQIWNDVARLSKIE